ncbi:MAG: fibronectin type III domain-containing protein [Spirochaetia bacterium]|nr:fibronectin type III domain-containing protein [Spirochaetia bacterium]
MKCKLIIKLLISLTLIFTLQCGSEEEPPIEDTPPASNDTIAPVFEGNVNAIAADNTTILINWDPAFDETTSFMQIDYEIFISDSLGNFDLTTANATVTGEFSYTATGLNANTMYMFLISAKDAAGNISNFLSVTATTLAISDIYAPVFSGLTGAENLSAANSSSIFITWPAAIDNITPSENIVYHIYVSTVSGGQDFNNPTVITEQGALFGSVSGLSSYTEYFVVVRAVDITGNIDSNVSEYSIFTFDATAPLFSGLRTAMPINGNTIKLAWNPAADNKDDSSLIVYKIYKSTTSGSFNYNSPDYITEPGETSFMFYGLTKGVAYFFVVRAIDSSGNENINTVQKSATPNDTGFIQVDVTVDGIYALPWMKPVNVEITGLAEYNVSTGKTIMTSADGSSWSHFNFGNNDIINDMIYDGSKYIAVGDNGAIYTSTDFSVWTKRLSGTDKRLNKVFYNGSKYLIVGDQGSIYAIILSSTDGINWSFSAGGFTFGSYYDILWDGANFVLVGDTGRLQYSTDGYNWIGSSIATGNYFTIYYDGATNYYAGGTNGALYKSSNLTSWTAVTNPATSTIRTIIHDGSKFIASGDNGLIMTSTDGASWSIITSNTTANISDMSFNGSLYTAVGNNGVILNSTDGTIWTVNNPNMHQKFFSVFWDGTDFITTGYTGGIAFQEAVAGTYTVTCNDDHTGFKIGTGQNISVNISQTTTVTCDYTFSSPFFDFFENTNDNWIANGANISYSNDCTGPNSSACAKLTLVSSTAKEFYRNFEPTINPSEISFYIGGSSYEADAKFFIGTDDTISFISGIGLSCRYSGGSPNFYIHDDATNGNTGIACENFPSLHHILIKNIDYTNHKFDIYIDGAKIGTYYFKNNMSSFNKISLKGGGGFGGSYFYFDDLVLENP